MTPRQDMLAELLSDTRAVVLRLLEEPAIPAPELLRAIDAFDAALAALGPLSRCDRPTAERLAAACRQLVAATAAEPDRLRLAQVAVRYVVLDDDADGDCESPYGFDDDVEVFNAVAANVGCAELLLRA